MAVIALARPTNLSSSITHFPYNAASITPSDADTFSVPVGVYVGGAGDLVVTPWNGAADVTFSGLTAGSVLPVMVKAVKSTGTTATLLRACY